VIEYRRTRGGNLFDQANTLLHQIRSGHDRAAIDLAAHGLTQRAALFFLCDGACDARGDLRCDMFVLKRLADTSRTRLFSQAAIAVSKLRKP
jgi:hypothetical protein